MRHRANDRKCACILAS